MTPGTMTMRAAACALAAALILALPVRARAGEELDRARDLYNAARYEEALKALNAMAPEQRKAEGGQVAAYTALCLLALGRSADAEAAVAEQIDAQPDFRPESADVSPRLAALVERVRRERLPALVRAQYDAGKASFAAHRDAEAAAAFARVIAMASDPGLDAHTRAALGDLAGLAKEYLGLIDTAATRSPVPALPGPVVTRAEAPATPPSSGLSPAPAVKLPAVFSATDAGVVPPTPLRQDMPHWIAAFGPLPPSERHATLELIIGRDGRVQSAHLDRALQPLYDAALITATRQWRYTPATRNGAAVPFRKLMTVILRPPA